MFCLVNLDVRQSRQANDSANLRHEKLMPQTAFFKTVLKFYISFLRHEIYLHMLRVFCCTLLIKHCFRWIFAAACA